MGPVKRCILWCVCDGLVVIFFVVHVVVVVMHCVAHCVFDSAVTTLPNFIPLLFFISYFVRFLFVQVTELATKYPHVHFAKVDVDKNPEVQIH